MLGAFTLITWGFLLKVYPSSLAPPTTAHETVSRGSLRIYFPLRSVCSMVSEKGLLEENTILILPHLKLYGMKKFILPLQEVVRNLKAFRKRGISH